MKLLRTTALLPILILAGCWDEPAQSSAPDATTLTVDSVGYYCQMLLVEHEGPKAQIHLADADEPLWFAQVRDGIAYLRSPEISAKIVAFYVSDIGAAENWAQPGADNWVAAEAAFFVIGSDARGGMGAPEIVPFGTKAGAESFAKARGGQVVRLPDIPAETVLAPVEMEMTTMNGMKMAPKGEVAGEEQ